MLLISHGRNLKRNSMKNPRDKKTDVDLTTLLDPEQLRNDNADDCFGKEWDPQDRDCSLCHDVEICGIVKQQTIETRKQKIEKDKGPFLDMTAFEKVPMDKIAINLKNWAAEDDPASLEELEETIGKAARTKDKVAIREYIKRTLHQFDLMITQDKTIKPYESPVNNDYTRQPITTKDAFRNPSV